MPTSTGTANQLAALLLLADARLPSGAHAHSFGLEAAVGRGLVRDLTDLGEWVRGCLHSTWLAEAGAAGLAALLAAQVGASPPAAAPTSRSEHCSPGHSTAAPVSDDRPMSSDRGSGAPKPALQDAWALLDAEIGARIGSLHGRDVSRTLGRQLLRTGRAVWSHPSLVLAAAVHPDGPSAPMALGAVTTAAGAEPDQAALLSLHHAVQSAGTAAIRLLGLDPFAIARLSASLGSTMTDLARTAMAGSRPSAEHTDPVARAAAPPSPTDATGPAPDVIGAARALPASGAPMLDILLTHHQHTEGRLFAS